MLVQRRRLLTDVSLLLTLAVVHADAQNPADRAALRAWNDSLLAITSTDALTQMESTAQAGRGAVGDLRFAMWQLHQAELVHDDALLQRTLIRLVGVANSHRDWPVAELLTTRAFAALARDNAPMRNAAGKTLGTSHVDAMWHHLARALTLDPTDLSTRRFAIGILLAEGDRELRGDEQAVVKRLLEASAPESGALLVAARAARTRLAYDSALNFLHRAMSGGGDQGVLDLEAARTLRALDSGESAAASYWDGLRHLTPNGREAYRYDLQWIVTPDSLAAFDRVADDSVVSWLHRFWNERDAQAANAAGGRLGEHLRRWVYAMAHFRVVAPWRRTDFRRVEYLFSGMSPCVYNDGDLYDLLAGEQPSYPGDIRHREPLLDHRGLIYLHHGEPWRRTFSGGSGIVSDTQRVWIAVRGGNRGGKAVGGSGTAGTGAAGGGDNEVSPAPNDGGFCINNASGPIGPNEAWLFWIDGTWRVFNFRGSCALGLQAPTTLSSFLPVSNASIGDWLARATLPGYGAAAATLYTYFSSPFGHPAPPTCKPAVRSLIRQSQVDAALGPRTDTDTPFIARSWNAVIQAFALGRDDSSGTALVTFAIPFDSLAAVAINGQATYAVHTRLVAFNRANGHMVTVDTIRHFIADANRKPAAYLSGGFRLPLTAGDWEMGVRMNQGVDSIGAYALASHLVVPGNDTLALSDIVPGISGGYALPTRDGARFPVNTLGAWWAGGAVEFYLEVYGLAPGSDYQLTIAVRDSAPGDHDRIRLASTEHAIEATTFVRRTLGLAGLEPGEYRVIITVTNRGHSVSRERRIVVVKRSR